MLKVGLTGGIGSGKSTAAKVFSSLGIPVYDSDSRAKALMHTEAVRDRIVAEFGPEAYSGGRLDAPYLAARVFNDPERLARLNAIVHPAVMADFLNWADRLRDAGCPYVIQENAILFDHGFDRGMDVTVTVSAPEDERAMRASRRDGHRAEQVAARMRNQMSDREREQRADHVLHNGERELFVPQIIRLHELFCRTDGERKCCGEDAL